MSGVTVTSAGSLTVLLLLGFAVAVSGDFNIYPRSAKIEATGNVGKPLLLTPLIQTGKTREAQIQSRVGKLLGDNGVPSYSGFLTVNQQYKSHLFFWFFPAEIDFAKAPVILWLQGGPGASSLIGLFRENGPFTLDNANNLKMRKYAWTKTMNMLYIDSPVGTGFSFTEDTRGYARNQSDIGRDLHIALMQFFTIFPEFKNNEFFVFGESYAGKMAPSVTYTIHMQNQIARTPVKINLKGMAIGNGITDPISLLNYGDYFYQLGLVDSKGRAQFRELERICIEQINNKQWTAALTTFGQTINSQLYPYGSLFFNLTGFTNLFNFLFDKPPPEIKFGQYVQSERVRRAIHVGNASFDDGNTIPGSYLVEDIMQSVKPWVQILLERYRVLIYSGNLDVIVGYVLTENFLKSLQWSGTEEYKNAERYQWKVRDRVAGYVKTAGFLTDLMVRNAGHLVPVEQQLWAYDLANRFTYNKSYH